MNVSRQIGWSNESNLLYQILKQLNKLTSIMFGLKPKYKVYTALLTQSGGDSPIGVAGDGEYINIGVTYQITDNPDNYDLTIYGAPNNSVGTFFVSNQTTALPYTNSLQLLGNTGAPVATVLENTIGDIWFTFSSNSVGYYTVNSGNLFINNKTVCFIGSVGDDVSASSYGYLRRINSEFIQILTQDSSAIDGNNLLNSAPIEIRVYN